MRKRILMLAVLVLPCLGQSQSNASWPIQPPTMPPSGTISGAISVLDFIPAELHAGIASGTNTLPLTPYLQAAIDALGTFSFRSGEIRTPVTYGGGFLQFPAGKFLTGPLRLPGAVTLQGVGLHTHLSFSGGAGEHLFERDPARLTKGATTENVAVRDMLITTTDPNPGDAIHLVAVEKTRLSNLTIAGFRYGIYFGNVGVPTGESYYHTLDGVDAHDNVVNLYVDTGGNALTCTGCYFWHSNTYSKADYTVILKGAGIVFNGGAIEGRPAVAQVYDQADSVTYNIGYSETRDIAHTHFKPFIKKRLSSSSPSATGGSLVNLPPGFGVLFEDFDLRKSDSTSTTTAARFPGLAMASTAQFIPAIANANMRHGAFGWRLAHDSVAGSVAHDPRVSFASSGALRLVHDGSGRPLDLEVPLDPEVVAHYVGRRVWLSALVRHSPSASTEQVLLSGAGNTQAKISSIYPAVDYGNGWRLYVADIPVLSPARLNARMRFTSRTPGDTIWVTNPQMFVNGFDLIPTSRDDVRPLRSPATPSSGTWVQGDVVLNSTSGPPLGWTCVSAGSPGTWESFGAVQSVSADRGDTSQTLRARFDAPIQRWATRLSADRTVALSAAGARNGDSFRIVRTGLGPFALNVGPGLKVIPPEVAAFVEVAFDGTAWRLVGFGPL